MQWYRRANPCRACRGIYLYTDFGIDSSKSFLLRARTDSHAVRQTDRQTNLETQLITLLTLLLPPT